MSNYWSERIAATNEKLFNKTSAECEKQLAEYYRRAAIQTRNDIEALFFEMQKKEKEGKLLVNDLYRNERYFEVMNNLNQRLVALGEKEIEIDTKYFNNIYKATGEKLGKYLQGVSFTFDTSADAIINAIWCADGKHFSNRIWADKTLLSNEIQDALVDGIVRGIARDKIVKNLMNKFNTSFSNANRIQRTEMCYVQNQAAAASYINAGVTKYRYLAELDGRTSEICKKLDGKEFLFSEAIVGTNMPPCHPNCRSTIIPII